MTKSNNKGYKSGSLTLNQTVSLGTGVMIGAGIFALLGQVAELSGTWFPYIFLLGAIVSGFSAYSYIKVSNASPSAGGIAMILTKAYGNKSILAASASSTLNILKSSFIHSKLEIKAGNKRKVRSEELICERQVYKSRRFFLFLIYINSISLFFQIVYLSQFLQKLL